MPQATQDTARVCRSFRLQGFNLLWPTIPGRSSSQARPYMTVLQPQPAHRLVWAGPRSLAATKGISVDFCSYGYLDVSVPRVRSDGLWIQPAVTGYDPCRVAPLGDLRIKGCLRLPEAYRSLPRPSSLPRAKASTLRPFLLDFYFRLSANAKPACPASHHPTPMIASSATDNMTGASSFAGFQLAKQNTSLSYLTSSLSKNQTRSAKSAHRPVSHRP